MTMGKELEIIACRLANQLGQDGFMAYAVPSRFGGVRETVQARTCASSVKSWLGVRL